MLALAQSLSIASVLLAGDMLLTEHGVSIVSAASHDMVPNIASPVVEPKLGLYGTFETISSFLLQSIAICIFKPVKN